MGSRLCFCLKRNRNEYDISSKQRSDVIMSTVTSPPTSLSPNLPMKSNYENLQDLVDEEENDTDKTYSSSIVLRDYDGYAKIVPVGSLQPSFCDDNGAELYATVDKTRIAKNSIRVKSDTNFPSSSGPTTRTT